MLSSAGDKAQKYFKTMTGLSEAIDQSKLNFNKIAKLGPWDIQQSQPQIVGRNKNSRGLQPIAKIKQGIVAWLGNHFFWKVGELLE